MIAMKMLALLLVPLLLLSACSTPPNTAMPDAIPVMSPSESGGEVSAVAEPESETPVEEKDGAITISFVGDCMLASYMGEYNWNTFNYRADIEEPEYFFAGVADILKADDFTVANCECVFTDRELAEIDKGYEGAYWYKSASKNAGIFTAGGVEIISLANNHTDDYGDEGKEDTIAAVEAAGLLWGDDENVVYVEKYGFRIAVICVSLPSARWYSHILSLLTEAEEKSDFQIVYFHGGTERVYSPPDYIVETCHALADAGADLLVGHHPHVLQPVEDYNGVKIVYSLGNFIFGAGRGENRTVIYQYKIDVQSGKTASESDKIIPCYVWVERWQPAPIGNEDIIERVLAFMRGESDDPL